MYINKGQQLGELGKFKFKLRLPKLPGIGKKIPLPLMPFVPPPMLKELAKRGAVTMPPGFAPKVAPAPAPAPAPVEVAPAPQVFYQPQPYMPPPQYYPQPYQAQPYMPPPAPIAYPTMPAVDQGAPAISPAPTVAPGADQAGWPGFFNWLETAHPSIAQAVDEKGLLTSPGSPFSEYDSGSASSSFDGLGADTTTAPAAAPSWVDSILQVAAPLIQTYQQQQVLKAQMKRAQAGLPPMKPEQYAPPPMRAQFGLDMGTLLPIVAVAGLIGVGLFVRGRRPRPARG